MDSNPARPAASVAMDVLQQFRVIYGSMRQYFRLVEERCGVSASQLWLLQEVQRSPGLGVGEAAKRMGIHQSTCSLLVDRLAGAGLLAKRRLSGDQRRVGLQLEPGGATVLARLPGPAEGLLPEALARLPEASLLTLNAHLDELIRHLSRREDGYAGTPLAEIVALPAADVAPAALRDVRTVPGAAPEEAQG